MSEIGKSEGVSKGLATKLKKTQISQNVLKKKERRKKEDESRNKSRPNMRQALETTNNLNKSIHTHT